MSKSIFYLIAILFVASCSDDRNGQKSADKSITPAKKKIEVILDTDANNELDDQHAIAYLLFNSDIFDIKGITVNRTRSGGPLQNHVAEAERVVRLCNAAGKVKVYPGADGSFEEIKAELDQPDHDGADAVNFIIEQAGAVRDGRLTLLPIGKLTNIALAIAKAPDITDNINVVWLGSNYPEPGEYNQNNDTAALNYLLNTQVPFEIVTVRYGRPSGSDAVRITPAEVQENMAGKGPKIEAPVTGRHGNSFTCFGDYAVDLFQHIDLHGTPPSRALFDVVAVAIIKHPSWGEKTSVPAPILVDDNWVDRPDNSRMITIWENFDRDAIVEDFYDRMQNYVLP